MEDTVTLSKRSTVLSMAAPSVESRARPPAPPSAAEQSSVSSAAAGPCSAWLPSSTLLLGPSLWALLQRCILGAQLRYDASVLVLEQHCTSA